MYIAKLTQDQFDLLNTTINWKIDEVPREHWGKIPGIQRLHDTFSIMASGTLDDPQLMNNINNIVAGMDVLTHERNPKYKGEKEGNAYHYVLQSVDDPDYPYLIYGPFYSESVVDHWFEADDLNKYWES